MRRPQQWSTRPGARALSSRYRRERYTFTDMQNAIDVSMRVGRSHGIKVGERELYYDLSEMIDDPAELAAHVAGVVLTQQCEAFLAVVIEEGMVGEYVDEEGDE